MTRRFARLVIVAAAVMLLAHTAAAQDPEYMSWKIDGERRRAIVYAPSAPAQRGQAPLILAFHGRGDTMDNFQYVDLHRAWPEAVVVYFDGLPSRRDGLRGWQVEKGQDEDRDLKLVDAALASLRRNFRIDEGRIYVVGFSNGAGFTYLLWAERPDVFAAFAPVAGRFRPSVKPSQPKPLFHVVGARDRLAFTAHQDNVGAALRTNGIAGAGEPCGNGCTLYGAGTAAPVMDWLHGAGHDFPEGTSERIAKFFREHPLKR